MSLLLDAVGKAAIDRYLELLGPALGGAVAGIYLTGSAALGDWQPGRSDLDILTVASRPFDEADLDALAALHADAADRPYLDAVYVCGADVGARLPPDHPGVPHVIDGVFRREGYRFDPVLWATLDRHGLTLSGPAAAELGAGPQPGWLREWNLGNLDTYWRSWAAEARLRLADRDPDVPLSTETVSFALLGPGRLHYTIATGGLLAKTAAADYTAEHFPGFAEPLARAKKWRLGDDAVRFMIPDAVAACDLIDAVADDAQIVSERLARRADSGRSGAETGSAAD
jgi:predicted nucleotidyltransferase